MWRCSHTTGCLDKFWDAFLLDRALYPRFMTMMRIGTNTDLKIASFAVLETPVL